MGSEFSEALRSNAMMNLRQPLILYVPEGQLGVGERSGFSHVYLIKKKKIKTKSSKRCIFKRSDQSAEFGCEGRYTLLSDPPNFHSILQISPVSKSLSVAAR